jgi:hypothetical protein
LFEGDRFIERLFGVLVPVIVGGAVYFISAYFLRVPGIRDFVSVFLKKVKN